MCFCLRKVYVTIQVPQGEIKVKIKYMKGVKILQLKIGTEMNSSMMLHDNSQLYKGLQESDRN